MTRWCMHHHVCEKKIDANLGTCVSCNQTSDRYCRYGQHTSFAPCAVARTHTIFICRAVYIHLWSRACAGSRPTNSPLPPLRDPPPPPPVRGRRASSPSARWHRRARRFSRGPEFLLHGGAQQQHHREDGRRERGARGPRVERDRDDSGHAAREAGPADRPREPPGRVGVRGSG